MSISPETVSFALGDTPRLVDFTSWAAHDGLTIQAAPVETDYFGGSLRPLPWNVWKFVEVAPSDSGSGVSGRLIFDATDAPPACRYWYESVLFRNSATILLTCISSHDPDPEVLRVQLTP